MKLNQTLISQLQRVGLVLCKIYLPLLGLVSLLLLIAHFNGIKSHILFDDIYEIADSRLAGIISNLGILLWTAVCSICFFTYFVIEGSLNRAKSWKTFFLFSAILSLVLLLDDFLSIHELGDDILVFFIPIEATRTIKNICELTVFAVYGIGLLAYLWIFRNLIYQSEYLFLLITIFWLFLSLVFDMLENSLFTHSYLFEESFKLLAIATYTLYFARLGKQKIQEFTFSN